jgi:hypothetical protein
VVFVNARLDLQGIGVEIAELFRVTAKEIKFLINKLANVTAHPILFEMA